MTPLPVDSYLDEVRAALDRHRAAVLVASPGAGKTTRVPPALVDRGLSRRGPTAAAERVLLLQPRRVAARAMARRIAEERGWTVGKEVGWHIRFERQFTRDTQLLVVTEGILTAYLQGDPLLSDTHTLILDEFHERSVHADLGLALAKQAWLARDDLRILIMSATLDTAPVSAFLGDCPVINVPGTLHPLAIDYATQAIGVAAVEVLHRTRGNVLCFLPGAREIEQAIVETRSAIASLDVDLLPLHGSLDAREQDAALQHDRGDGPASPERAARRRVIFATNIAETSLTVPGVSAVIDSGLHKLARYDPDRGVDSLTMERITLDSADQRAGRAARLGPGVVRRLWDARDRLRPHREAEIHRVDLSGPVLSILAAGADLASFDWFDRPSEDRLASAIDLLTRLGAVDGGAVTALGRQMQQLPLSPRLARLFVAGRGSTETCIACAWLAEPTRLEGAASTSSDLLTVIDRWRTMPAHLKNAAQQLEQMAPSLLGSARAAHVSEAELRRAVLAGYPDRVAKRRPQITSMTQNEHKVTLATGHGARLGRETGVHDAEWLVALDVAAGRTSPHTEATVRVASRIEPEWLAPTRSETRAEVDASGSIKARAIEWYDELVLTERPIAVTDESRAELLAAAWSPDGASARLLARLAFAGLAVDTSALVTQAAHGARQLRDIVLTADQLPWEMQQKLAKLAPDRLTVPSGRDMTIEYAPDGSVAVSVKLQELFGLAETPLLGPNRVPVTFHLTAPNGRPVQTTRDLKSFWERTYPEVRKELRGRYPKHPWPDDPWTAQATHRSTKGMKRDQENRSPKK